MNAYPPSSDAEHRAAKAGELEAFSGFNLAHVKQQVAELLRHIGEGGIFDEYTRHDIQHIESMLEMVKWLIPTPTQQEMSTADWLLIVLSIYFHDLGMLVTKEEYRNRNSTNFPEYAKQRLASADNEGKDYQERLKQLSDEERERFLYQEFVRAHHATRIRHWLEASGDARLGKAQKLSEEIRVLLSSLDMTFLRDLALVCESHHSDDLDDTNKYPIERPYGNSEDEVANVQYAAIMLRTTDLLQITRDRTPSIAFRVLAPSDPLSQGEWAKQMSVRAIRPQLARDNEGNVALGQERSIIDVHADFTEEDGFFGLTSYLTYASKQLNQSYEWAQESQRKHGSRFSFPWRSISTDHIRPIGFLPRQFEFRIDQAKILSLLTGHTLYNDSNVVIRELAQNAIDAVRLARMNAEKEGGSDLALHEGLVQIRWDLQSRMLEFRDNGTGMTQEIIEDNFLRVGSSRYQDPKFKEAHPGFNPISRFGIGVLSAFMIADSIEVYTCHPDEPEVRQISLRSVRGRYLIRLLNKGTDEIARSLMPHGTLVRLRVRASADVADVLEVAKTWFVLPNCRLTVSVDGKEDQRVGYTSLEDALRDLLVRHGVVREELFEDGSVQIRIARRGATSVAYAVIWSKWFRCWELLNSGNVWASAALSAPQFGSKRIRSEFPILGTCVEGVRVEFDTPGYRVRHIMAIANASGEGAPRTNVARSGLEDTAELSALRRDIYSIYLSHIQEEFDELRRSRGYSITRASSECEFFLNDLVGGSRDSGPVIDSREGSSIKNEIRQLRIFVVEDGYLRRPVSLAELDQSAESFFTIEDEFMQSAELFLRQLPDDASLRGLLEQVNASSSGLPHGLLLVRLPSTGLLSGLFRSEWEVSSLDCSQDAMRILVRWERNTEARWISVGALLDVNPIVRSVRDWQRLGMPFNYYLPLRPVEIVGLEDYDAVKVHGRVYIDPKSSFMKTIGNIDPTDHVSSTLAILGVELSLKWARIINKATDINELLDLYGGANLASQVLDGSGIDLQKEIESLTQNLDFLTATERKSVAARLGDIGPLQVFDLRGGERWRHR
jgi:hypothetical protein